MIPKVAAVRPRVRCEASGDTLPLEDAIQEHLDDGVDGAVRLDGPPGAGKSTALEHLAARFFDRPELLLADPGHPEEVPPPPRRGLLVYCASKPIGPRPLATYTLTPWTTDELIEYLLARHRERCAQVMQKLADPAAAGALGGRPELLCPVLDRLAEDPELPSPIAALRRHLESLMPDARCRERAHLFCLSLYTFSTSRLERLRRAFKPTRFEAALARFLRHLPVLRLLAADRIEEDLRKRRRCAYLVYGSMPEELLSELSGRIATDAELLERWQAHAEKRRSRRLTNIVSVLHLAGLEWKPAAGGKTILPEALLEKVRWRGLDLRDADLRGARLRDADLGECDLGGASLAKAGLRRASLAGARAAKLQAEAADFSGADLSGADLSRAALADAQLVKAMLRGASLRKASLVSADLRGAVLAGADLSGADLCMTSLDGADLTGAQLFGAVLDGVDLREAVLDGAGFEHAALRGARLDGLTLRGANFSAARMDSAFLTRTSMPNARFVEADLKRARLAGIDWEGAKLRGADLREAVFHLGSSRSGLVFSPIAGLGSRTGFYKDDLGELQFRRPEEIRQANLRGADLRGAKLDGVDFYLVDLRGALFDPIWGPSLERMGAILRDPE